MDFWQSLSGITFLVGLISSLVGIIGFFTDVRKLPNKHKIMLISGILAVIFIVGGSVSLVFHLTSSRVLNPNNSQTGTQTVSKSTPTITPSPTPTSQVILINQTSSCTNCLGGTNFSLIVKNATIDPANS